MNIMSYKKDAIDMFNKYYDKNNNNIKDTLIDMKKDNIIPYFFMKYYSQYTDFLNAFNISENIYLETECHLWLDQLIIRTKTIYEDEAIDIFNKYYRKNNNDIKDTLINMEKDYVIPYFFMKYYTIYTDFLKKFDINESMYRELKLPLWIDKDIIRLNNIIESAKCTRPIPKTK